MFLTTYITFMSSYLLLAGWLGGKVREGIGRRILFCCIFFFHLSVIAVD